VAAAALAGWAYNIHSRGGIVATAEALLILPTAARRWRGLLACLPALVTLSACTLIGRHLDRMVATDLYPGATGTWAATPSKGSAPRTAGAGRCG